MLSAHLPSGYLLGKAFAKNRQGRFILLAALIGAVIPDIDMLYFHFVDFGRTHHHMFITHWPFAWLALCTPVILLTHFIKRPQARNVALAFLTAVMLHMLLDSIAAPLFWLMPFALGRVELVTVPAQYSHWIISYILHWTFALELLIWLAAIIMFWRARKTS